MATDPLAFSPNPAPVPVPGLFDGQLATPDPLAQVQVANLEVDPLPTQGDLGPAQVPTLPAPVQIDETLGEEALGEEVPGEEVQVAAGIGAIFGRVLRSSDAKTSKQFGDVIEEGATAGVLNKNYTIVREASDDEVAEFDKLIGKTEGAPSPTSGQKARGIPAAEFNLQNINGPNELKQTIDNVSEIWKEAGRKAGRDKMTWVETQELAEQMGMRETVERLLRRKVGTAMNAEQITASLQAIATSGMELNRLAKIAANSTDAVDLLRFRQHMAFQSALQTNMKGAQMEAGRALAAFRIPRDTGTSRHAQTVQDFITDFGGDQSIRDMAKDYLALPSQSARNKFSYGAWDKIKGVWFEVWINGLLSSPSTQMANIFGNAAFQLIQIPERFGAGLIGLARQAMGSKADRVFLSETMADLIGMVQGVGDGWRLAGQAWRTEAPVRDLAGKVEAAQRRMITGANLAPNSSEFFQRGIDYLGVGIRLSGRGLMTMDEFFKAIGYRRELNSQALRIASNMKRNGSTRDQIADAVDDIFAGRNAEVTEVAERAAQYSTFTNPVEGLTGQMGAAVQGTVLGRMMVPFFKTPVNLFKAGAERSPYGFVKAIANAKDPIKRDMLIARASLGTATMAWAASQYSEGKITGSGPTDPDMRRQMESLGWKRWSLVNVKEGVENPRWLRAGHMYVLHPDDVEYTSYHRVEPVSMVLAIAADTAERFRWPTANQEEVTDIALSALDTVFNYMKEQTFLQGFGNIANVMSLRTQAQRNAAIDRLSQTLIGSQIPFSSLLASIERVMDPLQDSIIPDRNEPLGLRTLYAGLKRLDSRIPLTETGGPLLRDRFGNPRLQKGATVLDVLLPPFMADIFGDDVHKIEADQVMVEVVAAGVPLRMPPRKIDGVALTAEEYDAFVRFAANPPDLIVRGKRYPTESFYSALKDLVGGPSFADLPISRKQTLITGLDNHYKSIAKSYLINSEQFEERFADLRAKVKSNLAIIDAVGRQQQ